MKKEREKNKIGRLIELLNLKIGNEVLSHGLGKVNYLQEIYLFSKVLKVTLHSLSFEKDFKLIIS